jgi:hypothetical protein
VEIADVCDNQAYFTTTNLALLSFPSAIDVVSAVVDTTPVAVSSAVMTVTKAARASKSRSESGCYGWPIRRCPRQTNFENGSNAIVQMVSFAQDDAIPGQSVTLYEQFSFAQSAKTGTYQVQVELFVGNGNLATFSTATLASRCFLNAIQVNGV